MLGTNKQQAITSTTDVDDLKKKQQVEIKKKHITLALQYCYKCSGVINNLCPMIFRDIPWDLIGHSEWCHLIPMSDNKAFFLLIDGLALLWT